jgi:signal transduction histidine kinase
LDAVFREASRMSRMVNDLLLLARADNGDLQVDLYALDLDPIVLDVFEQAHILAKPRKLQIHLADIEPSRIYGNADRLKQLLLNLVNNAIKFTADDGSITISLTHQGDEARLAVSDTGIGISSEDKQRIFDRFFQADHSRVQRSESDGAGLGLSIVRWISQIHSGTIEVESEVGKGSTFIVRIPLLKDENTLPSSVNPKREQRTFEV